MADWLADSNIWLRSSEPDHPMFPAATQAVEAILKNDEIYLVPQVVNEFWRVATAPLDEQRGGLGWGVGRADRKVRALEAVFPMKYDDAEVYRWWRRIVLGDGVTGITGKHVHDARLVAAMLAHGMTHILTFNTKDFLRYESLGISVINPKDVTV